eukprot:TRINITY_DN2125_c1_g2_i2.p1 TRINITY_DN2125_c1_g2~~TRINITY_DN2125_c1_g2_i2.p1  ORF type:complete len:537 (+),score=188.48 TRINITY_DN2125_c1_g2_i2:77-1687(+)
MAETSGQRNSSNNKGKSKGTGAAQGPKGGKFGRPVAGAKPKEEKKKEVIPEPQGPSIKEYEFKESVASSKMSWAAVTGKNAAAAVAAPVPAPVEEKKEAPKEVPVEQKEEKKEVEAPTPAPVPEPVEAKEPAKKEKKKKKKAEKAAPVKEAPKPVQRSVFDAQDELVIVEAETIHHRTIATSDADAGRKFDQQKDLVMLPPNAITSNTEYTFDGTERDEPVPTPKKSPMSPPFANTTESWAEETQESTPISPMQPQPQPPQTQPQPPQSTPVAPIPQPETATTTATTTSTTPVHPANAPKVLDRSSWGMGGSQPNPMHVNREHFGSATSYDGPSSAMKHEGPSMGGHSMGGHSRPNGHHFGKKGNAPQNPPKGRGQYQNKAQNNNNSSNNNNANKQSQQPSQQPPQAAQQHVAAAGVPQGGKGAPGMPPTQYPYNLNMQQWGHYWQRHQQWPNWYSSPPGYAGYPGGYGYYPPMPTGYPPAAYAAGGEDYYSQGKGAQGTPFGYNDKQLPPSSYSPSPYPTYPQQPAGNRGAGKTN